jgi:sigma-B regulation protein RsbU (phosphoserine phosphatase)
MRALHIGFADEGVVLASLLLSTRGRLPGEFTIVGANLPSAIELSPQTVCRDGLIPSIISQVQPQLLQEVDWSGDPIFSRILHDYTSVIAIPFSSHRLPMNWVLLLKRSTERFSVRDIENALERVALGGALIENQTLAADLAAANEKIDREARQVGELQRALLPASVPQIAGLAIATSYEPSGRAGGDLYDFFPIDTDGDNRWCIFVGDASGHGLAAAVVMAIVQAVLRAHPRGVSTPADLLRHANQQLCGREIGGFFTAFLGVFDPTSHRFVYSNAGHPPPIVKRAASGSLDVLSDAVSYPLGIDGTEGFIEGAIQLNPQDQLLLYTDGISEARNSSGDMFALDGLQDALQRATGSPSDVIHHLRHAVRAHTVDIPPSDDQTMFVVEVL